MGIRLRKQYRGRTERPAARRDGFADQLEHLLHTLRADNGGVRFTQRREHVG